MRVTNDRLAGDWQAHTVLLALRIARHSEEGWNNPVLAQDYRAAADLLGLSPDAIRDKVMKLDESDVVDAGCLPMARDMPQSSGRDRGLQAEAGRDQPGLISS